MTGPILTAEELAEIAEDVNEFDEVCKMAGHNSVGRTAHAQRRRLLVSHAALSEQLAASKQRWPVAADAANELARQVLARTAERDDLRTQLAAINDAPVITDDKEIESSFGEYWGQREWPGPIRVAAHRAWCARAAQDTRSILQLQEKLAAANTNYEDSLKLHAKTIDVSNAAIADLRAQLAAAQATIAEWQIQCNRLTQNLRDSDKREAEERNRWYVAEATIAELTRSDQIWNRDFNLTVAELDQERAARIAAEARVGELRAALEKIVETAKGNESDWDYEGGDFSNYDDAVCYGVELGESRQAKIAEAALATPDTGAAAVLAAASDWLSQHDVLSVDGSGVEVNRFELAEYALESAVRAWREKRGESGK